MVEFAESETFRNLVEFFSRSSQAAIRYQRFARTAEYEDRKELAELFTRLAENEALYAQGHLDFLRAVCDPLSQQPFGGSVANLEASAASEAEDAGGMLPHFSRIAEAEGLVDIASWFRSVGESKAGTLRRLESQRRPHTPKPSGQATW